MRKARRFYDIEDLKGDRRSTGKSSISSQNKRVPSPDPEVNTKKSRRRFSKDYKLKILKEIDEATQPGQKGAILRREGLYSSNITYWHKQMDQGKLDKKRTSKHQKRIAELSKQNRKLRKELNQTKIIIEAQKKILQILEPENHP